MFFLIFGLLFGFEGWYVALDEGLEVRMGSYRVEVRVVQQHTRLAIAPTERYLEVTECLGSIGLEGIETGGVVVVVGQGVFSDELADPTECLVVVTEPIEGVMAEGVAVGGVAPEDLMEVGIGGKGVAASEVGLSAQEVGPGEVGIERVGVKDGMGEIADSLGMAMETLTERSEEIGGMGGRVDGEGTPQISLGGGVLLEGVVGLGAYGIARR
jgi:hypothetical protein